MGFFNVFLNHHQIQRINPKQLTNANHSLIDHASARVEYHWATTTATTIIIINNLNV